MQSTDKRPVLTVVMDGVGLAKSSFGNAVALASTPHMDWLKKNALYLPIKAHGKAVGLPSDKDMGNSEVGHNALGAGRTFDQGPKLVQNSIEDGSLFAGSVWQKALEQVKRHQSTLHLIGLLSDGNVHSHQDHLHSMLRKAAQDKGVGRIRIHVLLDGRDVPERSAEIYIERLEAVMQELRDQGVDVQAASGGGRMHITMDRYEADWSMVERGWNVHVHGKGAPVFGSLSEALSSLRESTGKSDQFLPGFVIGDAKQKDQPCGPIRDGDSVILFNFRGDRAIEICRAFTEDTFTAFDRGQRPEVFFAGMMQYDGDLEIPAHYLVAPPTIKHTLGELLAERGLRQFACSETQKFGHVTYFWNGNKSGYFHEKTEEYLELPSDLGDFHLRPWMKAAEIADATIERMHKQSFDVGRINFPNGDMVGHTGDLDASIIAVATVDLMLGRLLEAAKATGTVLLITADHGNCDQMFDTKEHIEDWRSLSIAERPKPKTSHTTNPVPLYIFDPSQNQHWTWNQAALNDSPPGLANIANTVLTLAGQQTDQAYKPSLVTSAGASS